MEEAIRQYRSILSQTPLDEFEVDERHGVRISPKDTWIEVRLRYLTDPRRVGKVKTELTARILEAFNREPERVKFPVGRSR